MVVHFPECIFGADISDAIHVVERLRRELSYERGVTLCTAEWTDSDRNRFSSVAAGVP
jgi:hypothetical protein